MPWYSLRMDEERATPDQRAKESELGRLTGPALYARALLPAFGYTLKGFAPLHIEPPLAEEHRAALEAHAGYPIAVQEMRITKEERVFTATDREGIVHTVVSRQFSAD